MSQVASPGELGKYGLPDSGLTRAPAACDHRLNGESYGRTLSRLRAFLLQPAPVRQIAFTLGHLRS